MPLQNLSNDYNQLFILVSLINMFFLFLVDYKNFLSLFMFLNSLSINYIIYRDIYFEIKNHRSNINFTLMPKYYPSYRNLTKFIWFLNSIAIFSSTIKLCVDFWMYQYEGFAFNKSLHYTFLLTIITLASNIIFCIVMIIMVYFILKCLSIIHKFLQQIMFNYINDQPFINKDKNDNDMVCWICDKNLTKTVILKKLICPCNEHFHPECIDKYLSLYNNYCRAGHKIAKYEHTA
jgi:hypothetical protein